MPSPQATSSRTCTCTRCGCSVVVGGLGERCMYGGLGRCLEMRRSVRTKTDTIVVVWTALFDGVSFATPSDTLNNLLSRGGMSSMLNTIWLIMCAMTFGAVLERIGLLKRVVSAFLKGATTAGDMITRTILTCIGTNIITADQYMAIVMPGRMYKNEFEKRGLHQLNLSRSLEDGGTLTSPLIPWNTCGVYMHGVLAVNPLDYIFFTFFNLINPVLAIIYAYLGIKILRIPIPDVVQASITAKT